MNPSIELLKLMGICVLLGAIIGCLIGWISRSMFVAKDIERISRESWQQARIHTRHGGSL